MVKKRVILDCLRKQFEQGYVPLDLPPGFEEKQYRWWLEGGGKVNQSANERQVGANHYRDVPGEQHWDRLIRLFGWPRAKVYFIGQATKYLERHEKKNGLQDLEKALHFCEKIVEEEKKYQLSLPLREQENEDEQES